MMKFILSFIFLLLYLPLIFSLFSLKNILCNKPISILNLNSSMTIDQNISLNLCNIIFNVRIHPNPYFFSKNISISQSIENQTNHHFTYIGDIIGETSSTISLIIYPHLQIYLYFNHIYYYYLSLSTYSVIILKFSQKQLLQYYPQLINNTLWKILHNEENIYRKNSFILHDLHFMYGLLTLKCQLKYQTLSLCSLALLIDKILYEKIFNFNMYSIYTYIEHFNFLLRTLTNNEYGGFQLKTIKLMNHIEINSNTSLDLLHNLSYNTNLSLKNYCLVHQMFLSNNTYVLGYQSSIHTYDIGGICSLPFNMNNNNSKEINLNIGITILNKQIRKNLTFYFDSLMKISYLFFRQMGLNLTLCSINRTRKSFFQFNTESSHIVEHCIDLIPRTLHLTLQQRAHLCFNHVSMSNSTNQSLKQQCKQLKSSVLIAENNRKSPHIENALNDNRHGEWIEGNIVGMILTFSLLIWIPVSCFVHFCIDEKNKKSFIEKQQEIETLQTRSLIIEQTGISKQTQTD